MSFLVELYNKKNKSILDKKSRKTRKRLDTLPDGIHWDVCNTLRAGKNWFTVTIIKENGNKTSTAVNDVYSGVKKYVENRLNRGLFSLEEAIDYYNSYDPKMEKGFTMKKAASRSKVSER